MNRRGYWEDRYSSGGNSGAGSAGANRKWKWGVINIYIERIFDVIDVGCGDLTFWNGRTCEKYTGIDISKTIINKNKIARPDWNFIVSDADTDFRLRANVVLCFDVLFHIMNERTYTKILENMCRYSTEWIFIFTWNRNPLADESDGTYQYYRDFTKYKHIFDNSNFDLIGAYTERNSVGTMYIFKKKEI